MDKRVSLVSNIGYKNLLASQAVDRMAKEKKFKLTLLQELESIKDKFAELELLMKKLELQDNMDQAAMFMQEQVKVSYYAILSCLQ